MFQFIIPNAQNESAPHLFTKAASFDENQQLFTDTRAVL